MTNTKRLIVFSILLCSAVPTFPALGWTEQDVALKNAENFGRVIGTLEVCGYDLSISKKAIFLVIESGDHTEARMQELKQTFEIAIAAQEVVLLATKNREKTCSVVLQSVRERSGGFMDLIKKGMADQTPN